MKSRILDVPNVWSQPRVSAEPRKRIDSWQIIRVVRAADHKDRFGLHFVGSDCRDFTGAVSSKIIEFDRETMCGKTSSGRVYELAGQPGHSSDGQYVLHYWLLSNRVEIEDSTIQFCQAHQISTAHIEEVRLKREAERVRQAKAAQAECDAWLAREKARRYTGRYRTRRNRGL